MYIYCTFIYMDIYVLKLQKNLKSKIIFIEIKLTQSAQVIENFAIRIIIIPKAVIISVFVCLASSVCSSRKNLA